MDVVYSHRPGCDRSVLTDGPASACTRRDSGTGGGCQRQAVAMTATVIQDDAREAPERTGDI